MTTKHPISPVNSINPLAQLKALFQNRPNQAQRPIQNVAVKVCDKGSDVPLSFAASSNPAILVAIEKARDLIPPTSQQGHKEMSKLLKILANHDSPITFNLLNMLIGGINAGKVKTAQELRWHLLEITTQVLIAEYLRADTDNQREAILKEYESYAVPDNLPWGLNDPRAKQAFEEIKRIHYRGKSIKHAFSILLFDSRRTPDGAFPLLARYGNDSSKETFFIDAKDIHSYPGRGFMFPGLIPERLFVPGTKDKWTDLAADFDAINYTNYIFLRGGIIASSPNDESHEITVNADGRKAHYSYWIPNDHFGGRNFVHVGSESFYLIPTEIIERKLKGTLIPYKVFSGYGTAEIDINDTGFNLEEFVKEANAIGAPVIHLGNGSTFAGGFSNALTPGTKWYYPDERQLANQGWIYVDAWGNTHKGDITGSYIPELTGVNNALTKEMRRKLKPHQMFHEEVVHVADSLQNRLELALMGYANYLKGITVSEVDFELNADEYLVDIDVESPDDSLFGAAYEDMTYRDGSYAADLDNFDLDKETRAWKDHIDSEPLSKFDMRGAEQFLVPAKNVSELRNNPNIYRMLVEAYRWHNGLKQKGITNRDEYPVIALGPEANLWRIIESPFYFDTLDLTLRVKNRMIQFPEDPKGEGNEEAENIWNNFVLPYYMGRYVPRLYHRKDLGFE